MTRAPSVDVVVPCYNYGRYLAGCVQTLLSQTGVDVRVLIIDDASTDDTERVGQSLARQDPRITFRRHVRNRGHIATYNEGIEWASRDYFVLLSADDLIAPGAFNRACAALESHERASFAYGAELQFTDANSASVLSEIPSVREPAVVHEGEQFIRRMCERAVNFVPTPTVLVRTAAQKRAGDYKPELAHSGDMEMWLRFAALGSVVEFFTVQACYRVHAENMHKKNMRDPTLDIRQRLEAFDAFFAGYDSSSADELQSVARRTLAEEALWRATVAFEDGQLQICGAFLQFAVTADRNITGTAEWRHLKIKRALGPTAWSRFAPMIARMRRLAKSGFQRA